MNRSILSGYIANDPKYTVKHEHRETMLRAILIADDDMATIVPLVFFDWCAERARRKLKKNAHVVVDGKFEGRPYVDDFGARSYQHFLEVDDFSCTLSEDGDCNTKKQETQKCRDERFPLDVTDLEDIIKCVNEIRRAYGTYD